MDSGTIDWTVVSVGIALAGLILVTTQRMRADMRADMKALSDQVNKLAERVGRLEEGQARMDEVLETLSAGQDKLAERVGRLEERQAHTAGLLEGLQGSLFDRARRVSTGERVAEDAESYETEG